MSISARWDGVANTEIHTFEKIACTVGRFGETEQKKRFDDIRQYIHGN